MPGGRPAASIGARLSRWDLVSTETPRREPAEDRSPRTERAKAFDSGAALRMDPAPAPAHRCIPTRYFHSHPEGLRRGIIN